MIPWYSVLLPSFTERFHIRSNLFSSFALSKVMERIVVFPFLEQVFWNKISRKDCLFQFLLFNKPLKILFIKLCQLIWNLLVLSLDNYGFKSLMFILDTSSSALLPEPCGRSTAFLTLCSGVLFELLSVWSMLSVINNICRKKLLLWKQWLYLISPNYINLFDIFGLTLWSCTLSAFQILHLFSFVIE